ncbi:hypothetical protein [Amphibacillus sediminis]|uniref:hypothetical protein n=1 Tax=Amphibacillus sediminis TaxID=360185 RepID=UPI0008361DC0|nr:hypothetical protein [Amphibacillus sediminis]
MLESYIFFKDGLLPRIDAHVAGGYGLSINYLLIFDEARKIDTIYQINGISIRVDYGDETIS